ncbi:MAG: hypothetical protein IKU84_06990 [Clostridia bacterium]|nr:hypothetical protein [Clostridia bacterium]
MRPMLRMSLEAVLIFVIQMILSAVSTYLFTSGILPQTYTVCVLLALVCLVFTVVFLVVGIVAKSNRGFPPRDVMVSYLCVVACFAVITLFMAGTGLEPFLTLMFLGYKVFAFGTLPRFLSAIIVNLVIFGLCTLTAVLCNKQAEAERIRSYLKDDNSIDS